MKNTLDTQTENEHGRTRAKPNGRRAQRVYLESLTSWIAKGEAIYHEGKLLGFMPAAQYRIPDCGFLRPEKARPCVRFSKVARQQYGLGRVASIRRHRFGAQKQALGELRAEAERKIRVSQEDAQRLLAAWGPSTNSKCEQQIIGRFDPAPTEDGIKSPFPLHVGDSL